MQPVAHVAEAGERQPTAGPERRAGAVTSALSRRQASDRVTQMRKRRIDDLRPVVEMAAEDPDEGADILAVTEADLGCAKDLSDLESVRCWTSTKDATPSSRSAAPGRAWTPPTRPDPPAHVPARRRGAATDQGHETPPTPRPVRRPSEIQAPYRLWRAATSGFGTPPRAHQPLTTGGVARLPSAVEVIPLVRPEDLVRSPGSEAKDRRLSPQSWRTVKNQHDATRPVRMTHPDEDSVHAG